MPFPFQKLAVFGPGLLGGSICLAAREKRISKKTAVWARRADSAAEILRMGAADEAGTDPGMMVAGADLVVLCTPIGVMSELSNRFLADLAETAIVTDVGSVKGPVVTALEAIFTERGKFVGSHPMAGSEQAGLEAATSSLFEGSTCILTPTDKTDPTALQKVGQFWMACGSVLRELSPLEHDRIIGSLSHLPHAVAAALACAASEVCDQPADFCGNGLLDSTRIAGGPPGMWTEIFLNNREVLLESIKRMEAQLQRLKQGLSNSDAAAIEQFLSQAKTDRDRCTKS